jgi:hypothetical protein
LSQYLACIGLFLDMQGEWWWSLLRYLSTGQMIWCRCLEGCCTDTSQCWGSGPFCSRIIFLDAGRDQTQLFFTLFENVFFEMVRFVIDFTPQH